MNKRLFKSYFTEKALKNVSLKLQKSGITAYVLGLKKKFTNLNETNKFKRNV